MKEQLEAMTKEKTKTEQRLNSSSARVTKLVNELKEEKQMNENLLHNQIAWQKKFSDMEKNMEQMRLEKDREITDLKVNKHLSTSIFLGPNRLLQQKQNSFQAINRSSLLFSFCLMYLCLIRASSVNMS